MDLKLSGKKVIVVGGTRGIGRSIAECFSEEGCNVAICARNKDQVDETVKFLQAKGNMAYGERVDVTDTVNFKKWINHATNTLGGLDIYISNVSAQSSDWEKSYQVDILACVHGIEAALPHLEKSPHASIIAIASKAALLKVPSYKAYSAVKAALISYISSLSKELSPKGIRVNIVSPGEIYFDKGFWHRIEKEDPELFKKTLEKNNIGRFGTPEEVARTVVFLSSPAASFISGANLLVDGGSLEHVQF